MRLELQEKSQKGQKPITKSKEKKKYKAKRPEPGKPYGIKLRCYWERLREQLRELQGNMIRTCYEHLGNKEEKL